MRHILTPSKLNDLVGGEIEFIGNNQRYHLRGPIASIQLVREGGHLRLDVTCTQIDEAKNPSNLSKKEGWKSVSKLEYFINLLNYTVEESADGRIYLQFQTEIVVLSVKSLCEPPKKKAIDES